MSRFAESGALHSNRAIRNSQSQPPDMAFGVTENATNPRVCEFVIECRLGLCDKGTTDCASGGIKRSWQPAGSAATDWVGASPALDGLWAV